MPSSSGEYTQQQLDAAIARISKPENLRRAEQLVARAIPGLQGIIDRALHDGGWFSQGHEQQLATIAREQDPQMQSQLLTALVAEESRLAMLVGVTVGIELARQLDNPDSVQLPITKNQPENLISHAQTDFPWPLIDLA